VTKLAEHGIRCSLSGRGNFYDNPAMENGFGLLKRERVNNRRYRTRAEARQDVFDYIERFIQSTSATRVGRKDESTTL